MWPLVQAWLFPVWCIGCGTMDVALCVRCAAGAVPRRVALPGLAVRTAAVYEGHVRAAVLALKRGERAFLDPLAALLGPLVPAGSTLIPVPTTRSRAAARGFDQARELARRVAATGRCATVDALWKRGRPQHGRDRAGRLGASGRFTLRPGVDLPPAALLVDDVLTTGATLLDAAATLRRAGLRVSGAIVVAHAPLRETSPSGGESDEA